MIEPEIEPSPPRTTMATTSNDFTNVNMLGLRYRKCEPYRAPATPASAEPITNAFTL